MVASHLQSREIPSYEHLLHELQKVQAHGKLPHVINLDHTYDFISFIEPFLCKMVGHSNFQQFSIKRVDGQVKMFLKENELDEFWKFPSGVRLLKEVSLPLSLKVATWREVSDYGSIYSSVIKKYFPTLKNRYDEETVDTIMGNWETRIKFLVEHTHLRSARACIFPFSRVMD